MKDMKLFISFAINIALIIVILTGGMGRSEAHAILNERGAVEYEDDYVIIYIEESPAILEIEAAAKIAETAEGVIIKTMK